MIIVDEEDPVGDITLSFEPRNVTVKKGVDAKEFYDLLSEIGRGKFGTVYKCQEKSTGLKLAAKFIPIPKRDDRRNVEREVEIMNSLQHSLVIQLYDAFEYGKMMCVILELIEGGELFDRVIDDEFLLTEKACTVLVRQLCQAMEFMHSNNIIHLDLKPENILCLTRDGNRIKIIDFGLARRYDPDKKLQVLFGTPEFVAPEVVNFDRISFGTDMWSVGVICYVLLSGLSPFMGSTDVETMTNVTIGKYDFDDEAFSKVSKDSLDFIAKLLEKDLDTRMTADQCLDHPWLKQTPKKLQKTVDDTKIVENVKSPSIEIHDVIENGHQPLVSSKENLKMFIERWEEHDNSPYMFDANSSLILPVHEIEKNTSSGFSSRGCSPSPCESLSSNTELFQNGGDTISNNDDNPIKTMETQDADVESEMKINSKPSAQKELFERPGSSCSLNRRNKEYLQSFDRRHSDSNYVVNRANGLEKLNLAEEIKKLSDRLLMLSSINDELIEYNKCINDNNNNKNNNNDNNKPIITRTKSTTNDIRKSEIMKNIKNTSISSSFSSSSTIKKSFNEHFLIHSKSLITEDDMASTSQMTKSSVVSDLTERLKSLDETPRIFQDFVSMKADPVSRIMENVETIANGVDRLQSATTMSSSSSSSSTSPCMGSIRNSGGGGGGGGSAPWPITNKRTKFRVTQLSRDVPIGSPDSHQTVFLEEAAETTKDCLLHLLDKYNSKESRSINMIRRHQSISAGHGITDNLECQTMNSLNAFFKRNAFQHNGTTVRKIKARIESNGK